MTCTLIFPSYTLLNAFMSERLKPRSFPETAHDFTVIGIPILRLAASPLPAAGRGPRAATLAFLRALVINYNELNTNSTLARRVQTIWYGILQKCVLAYHAESKRRPGLHLGLLYAGSARPGHLYVLLDRQQLIPFEEGGQFKLRQGLDPTERGLHGELALVPHYQHGLTHLQRGDGHKDVLAGNATYHTLLASVLDQLVQPHGAHEPGLIGQHLHRPVVAVVLLVAEEVGAVSVAPVVPVDHTLEGVDTEQSNGRYSDPQRAHLVVGEEPTEAARTAGCERVRGSLALHKQRRLEEEHAE
eukprot:scaffold83043_cov57-Phaeocystis_antarctica.AAC.6